jgi:EAL domain-containing protein (putative c-di-GMP-specific phosphodiesterase class I)
MHHFPAQSVLFREGEPGDCAYVIERGRVAVSVVRDGHRTVLAELGPGDLIGEMALIRDDPRSATVTALEPTEVAVIERDHLGPVLEAADPVLKLFLRVLLQRFHEVSEKSRGMRASDSRPAPDDAAYRDDLEQTVSDVRMRAELARALEAREFRLFYQPIIDLASMQIAGYEALVRWQHPRRGLVGPFEFIGFAEKHGQIHDLGAWVLEEACGATRRLGGRAAALGRLPPFVSVNVSAAQLEQDGFIDLAGAIFKRTGVDPRLIKLEVTESLLMSDPERASALLAETKALGVTLALDDFGTGYSSLSYLHRFPFDTLKIDRSFVMTMNRNRGSMEVVRCILGMSRGLLLDVVAEGIEGEDELLQLRDLGCTYGQGYHFARPAPEEEAFALLARGA